jgi:hypothetical protein
MTAAIEGIVLRKNKEVGMNRKRLLVAIGLCGFIVASRLVVLFASTPVIDTTADIYYGAYASNWGIIVYNGDPNHPVHYREYRWNGAQYALNYGPEIVGYTNEYGVFTWYTYGPNQVGSYYSEVTVNGQVSNAAYFSVYPN